MFLDEEIFVCKLVPGLVNKLASVQFVCVGQYCSLIHNKYDMHLITFVKNFVLFV